MSGNGEVEAVVGVGWVRGEEKNVYVYCDAVRGTNKSFMKGLLKKKERKGSATYGG